MNFCPISHPASPYYEEAMTLYASSFPLYEQRLPADQLRVMKDPAFHCNALVENGVFVGILFYWEGTEITYVEHFAVSGECRGRGTGSRALTQLCAARSSVILEIDPPHDPISIRRKNFYQRMGFCENPYAHFHPAYRPGISPHSLLVMSWPSPLSEEGYQRFFDFLSERVMR